MTFSDVCIACSSRDIFVTNRVHTLGYSVGHLGVLGMPGTPGLHKEVRTSVSRMRVHDADFDTNAPLSM